MENRWNNVIYLNTVYTQKTDLRLLSAAVEFDSSQSICIPVKLAVVAKIYDCYRTNVQLIRGIKLTSRW